jgi:hypothetical protein
VVVQRRPVPPPVEAIIALVEDSRRGSTARRYMG